MRIPNVKIRKTYRRLVWENPLRLEIVVGKRLGGGDDELRVLIRLDPGLKSKMIFITRKGVKIKNLKEGAKIIRKLLKAVVRSIPTAHKGRGSIMTPAHIDRIVAEVEEIGHSTTSDWAAKDTGEKLDRVLQQAG